MKKFHIYLENSYKFCENSFILMNSIRSFLTLSNYILNPPYHHLKRVFYKSRKICIILTKACPSESNFLETFFCKTIGHKRFLHTYDQYYLTLVFLAIKKVGRKDYLLLSLHNFFLRSSDAQTWSNIFNSYSRLG